MNYIESASYREQHRVADDVARYGENARALYLAALAADEAFSRALVAVYGAAEARVARYQPQRWPESVRDASQRLRVATEAWLPIARGILLHKRLPD